MSAQTPRIGLFLMLALSSAVATGQEMGGQVRDETGGSLRSASVTAVSQERGFTLSTTTDAAGRFRFLEIQPGRYEVTVSLSGFTTVTLTDNLVETNKRTDLAVTMKLSAQQAAVTVKGEVPIVDKSNGSLEMRQRQKEFEKMPLPGRAYQSLFLNAPGVNLTPGTNPNPSVHGALGSNNLWLFDGVDTTDPATGGWGSNLNFEAIQEVTVITAGVSAEYGRATGGIINVITKSGTNDFAGSAKVIMTNDNWNSQNTTASIQCSTATTCTHPSLARAKFDHVNPRYAVTLGGPFWADHIWFFGAYESANKTNGQQSTPVSLENFQETRHDHSWEGKVTAQLTPSITASVRGLSSPISGFIIPYGNPAEFVAYTGQDQTMQQYAGFLTGVLKPNLTAEAQYNWNGPGDHASKHLIDVYPLGGGVPHYSEADGFYYNGAYFVGFVNRPRQGALGALTYYTEIGPNSHSFKAGIDYQHLDSAVQLVFPGNQLFLDQSFDFRTRVSVPHQRQDYAPPEATISAGDIIAVYVRDKFEVGKRLFLELGLRYEHQKSNDDINRTTVNAGTISPRFSASYDLLGSGKSLIVGTYGRSYQFVLQAFSDSFGQNVQQATYDNFEWNGTTYVFSNHVAGLGSAAQIPSNLRPTSTDEGTLGFRQQIGNTMGVSLTGIYRHWKDFIEDVPVFDSAGNRTITNTNYAPAARQFYGVELVVDKRFSEHWSANASYAWGKTTGNQFTALAGSSLGDYLTSNCKTTIDTAIGSGGILPCSIVDEGPSKTGQPTLSINNSLKAFGVYAQSFGSVNLALGLGGLASSGIHYQKQRIMNVLIPGTTRNAGPTETYFYDPRGSETTPSIYEIDMSLEATFMVYRTIELGLKGEVFNVTNVQRQVNVNSLNWCSDAAAGPATPCAISRTTFGIPTTRDAFQAPRSYRLTALMRF